MNRVLTLTLAGASFLMAGNSAQKAIDAIVWPVDPIYAGIDADALVAAERGTSLYSAAKVKDDCKEGPGRGLGRCKDDLPGQVPEAGTVGLMAVAGATLLAVKALERAKQK